MILVSARCAHLRQLRSSITLSSWRKYLLLSDEPTEDPNQGLKPLSIAWRSRSFLPQWWKGTITDIEEDGGKEEVKQGKARASSEMTLDTYAIMMKRGSQVDRVTSMFKTGSSNQAYSDMVDLTDRVARAMTEEEKKDISKFGVQERSRVARACSCSTVQVDHVIRMYKYTSLVAQEAEILQKQKKALPKTEEEMHKLFETALKRRNVKDLNLPQKRPAAAAAAAPRNLLGVNGKPCPFAGRIVSRTTKCPDSKKSWKNCCGKKTPKLQTANA